MLTQHNVAEIAQRFASALDTEDYELVRDMLAADCRYHARTGTLQGRDAIISSYRNNGEAAWRLFDTVEYSSELVETAANQACLCFSDRISKGGRKHVFQCRQRLHINSDGLIADIQHEEVPGEREGLLEFCSACGVALDEVR